MSQFTVQPDRLPEVPGQVGSLQAAGALEASILRLAEQCQALAERLERAGASGQLADLDSGTSIPSPA